MRDLVMRKARELEPLWLGLANELNQELSAWVDEEKELKKRLEEATEQVELRLELLDELKKVRER